MDAVEYFKIKNRICAAQEDTCLSCPLTNDCLSKELEAPEEVVKIAEEWDKKHPCRTRQTDFLEIYPDAKMIDGNINDELVIDIKPCELMANYATEKWCEKWTCLACKKLYWWKPLPEKKMKKLDSIEEQPQKTGKWKMNSYYPDRLTCTECGAMFDCWHWETEQMHFCPNCGTRMEEDNETD